MNKVNIILIIKDHFKSLVDINTKKAGFSDWFTFLFLPLLLAFILIWVGLEINNESIETIVGSLAIFVGLLFNALVMLLDIARKKEKNITKKNIVKHLIANISFAIIISFVSILFMLLCFLTWLSRNQQIFLNFICFTFISEFLLVFLMILKRTYLIFKEELTEVPDAKEKLTQS